MKVLVIGGTLFIGKLLVAELLKAGHQVTIVHRRAQHPFGKRVQSLIADRNDVEAIRRAISSAGFEVVFDNVYDWERGTTAQHIEAAAKACGDRLKRYIFMSSVAAYADGLNHHEGDALAPDDHPDAYVRNKAQSERMLFRLHQRNGFPVVTFRPPFVYGPENPFYREAFFWDRMRDKRPIVIPGDGRRLMQFAFVKDIVRACLQAMTAPAAVGEAFNVGNTRPLAQIDVVEALGCAANKKPTLVRVPRERIAAAGGNPMGEPAYFGIYYDLPPITMVVAKIKRMLGIEPVDFASGLKQTYRWYLRNHRRPAIDYTFEDRLLALGSIRADSNKLTPTIAR